MYPGYWFNPQILAIDKHQARPPPILVQPGQLGLSHQDQWIQADISVQEDF